MTTRYLTNFTVTLCAVHHNRSLPVRIGINDDLDNICVDDKTVTEFNFYADSRCRLHIELIDKKENEAVIIEQISFFGIQDPKFVWAGVYKPQYPEPWATEQRNAGQILHPELCPHTYLSWPGIWTLDFDVPIFTWIHNTQDLGWIYD
jgi:hypothetical protein